ncbi:NADH-quinone oxidoreductase subunit J [uncultured Desulfobulbus sp.]|uniref:NADH-quinone oxidoreductase subunit J family protein n=1 Tax=uncultured Desulfobulbus sp. TaxID=239745 RepID=UPI0029C70993|nr:NADH-quinone oxidoreductase subunit J [uncultured Desulfobulbus sp.]
MQGAQLCFWLITVMVLVSGFVAAFARNIVQAAYSLFFTLIGMAGYYVLLGSDFLAITQVIIYVGGILVLLMFGVLLTNRPLERAQKGTLKLYLAGGLAGAGLLVLVLFQIIMTTPWKMAAGPLAEPQSNLRPLGIKLMTQYLLPFELAGLTLLLCLIGAAYLVRRRER